MERQGENEMISEAVKITVKVESGQRFAKIVTISSYGAWDEVQREVSKIVGQEFASFKVEEFWWNYV
jgi:hypothetical protein